MTLVTIPGAGVLWPHVPPFETVSWTFGTSALIDATGEKIHHVGRVMWSDGGTHDITGFIFVAGTIVSAGGSRIDVSLQDVSLTAGPAPRGDAVKDQTANVLLSALTGSSWNSVTFGAARASVAHLSRIAIVTEFDSGGRLGADSLIMQGLAQGLIRTSEAASLTLEAPAATFTDRQEYPVCALTTGDSGVYGWLLGSFPIISVGMATLSTTTDPDEVGNRVVFTTPCTLIGVRLPLAATNTANFSIIFYDGTTAVETHAVDANSIPGLSSTTETKWKTFYFDTPITPTVGSTYRVIIRADFTTSLSVQTVGCLSNSYLNAFAGIDCYYTRRVDAAGSWTDFNDTWVVMQFILGKLNDASGGGGGLLRANMSGGAL